ncbi:hypothetical protein [Sinanaerobacter sp. ZZT-01]|nr:hypothetical protein [Sinanaerobacter sp. ZZT-01]WRR92795.1 hypothetical protein U5921_12245 [Sinanaerobacter sp. ZZT-01]
MKQIIVMVATILLGIAIFYMIMGPQDNSVYSTVQGVWKQEIDVRTKSP